MFTKFFYLLRQVGIPVSPTSFLRLQKALGMGLIYGRPVDPCQEREIF